MLRQFLEQLEKTGEQRTITDNNLMRRFALHNGSNRGVRRKKELSHNSQMEDFLVVSIKILIKRDKTTIFSQIN